MSETSDSDDEVTADGQLYDVILMHSEKEKNLANTVCEKIRQLNLGDNVFPVIDTFENMSLLGNQEVDDVDYAVEQSTFIMFFRTKEFFKDEIRSFAAGVALDNAIRSRDKSSRWSLIPIDIERKVKISRKPSINSLSGFTITTNGDFDKDTERVRRTLSSKMHVRLKREKRKAEKNARTLEKEVVENQACQHPSVDGGGVNTVKARVTGSHHNDMTDLVSGMDNVRLDFTSVKRPASESLTSQLYPGPNCEETGDEALGNVQPDRASIPETGPNYLEVANPSMGPEESTSKLLPRTAEIPRGDRFSYDNSQGDATIIRASSNSTAMSTYSVSNVSNDTGLQPQYSAVADVGTAIVSLGRQAGGNLKTVILHSDQHSSQDSLHLTNTPTLPFRRSSLSEFSLLAEGTEASLNSSDGLSCLQKGPNDVGGFVQSQETQNVVDSVGGALYTAAMSTNVLPRELHNLQQQQTIHHQQQQRQYSQPLQQQNRLQLQQIQLHQQRKQPRQQQSQYLQQQAQTEYNCDNFGFADLARGSQSHNFGCSVDSGIGSTIPCNACGGPECQGNTGYLSRYAERSGSREVTSVSCEDVYPVGDDVSEGHSASDPGYASADLTDCLNRDPYHVSHGPSVPRGPPAVAREPPTVSDVTAATRGPPDGSELPVESARSEVSPGASGTKPSSGNENQHQDYSGMLHTGFDAPADSLELHCIKHCVDRVFDVFDKLGVPYSKNGSIMVAWNSEQACKLQEIYSDAVCKGVKDIFHLPLDELYRREPFLSRDAHGALWIPGEAVLEPCLYGLLLAHHAKKNGAKILTKCEVTGWESLNDGQQSKLWTTRGPVTARVVINCAGLYGDNVQALAGIDTFRIQPRKGQYTVYGQGTSHLITSSILPVPTEKTKGIIVFKTVHGNVIVGPTAEDVESRQRAPIDSTTTQRLLQHGHRIVPELNKWSPVGHYTGLRPATQYKDYQIRSYLHRNWITVGGIRSTGVSGSLGIAEYVAGLVRKDLKLEPKGAPVSDLQRSEWSLHPDGTLSVDGTVYGVSHPITLFGVQKPGLSSSRL